MPKSPEEQSRGIPEGQPPQEREEMTTPEERPPREASAAEIAEQREVSLFSAVKEQITSALATINTAEGIRDDSVQKYQILQKAHSELQDAIMYLNKIQEPHFEVFLHDFRRKVRGKDF